MHKRADKTALFYLQYIGTKYIFDCSEIAEDLFNVSGKGKIYEVTPNSGDLHMLEYGELDKFKYHTIYSDGKYIFDPRYSDIPILENDYFKMLEDLNPNGITIKIE